MNIFMCLYIHNNEQYRLRAQMISNRNIYGSQYQKAPQYPSSFQLELSWQKMDRWLSAPSVSKHALKRPSSRKMCPATVSDDGNSTN